MHRYNQVFFLYFYMYYIFFSPWTSLSVTLRSEAHLFKQQSTDAIRYFSCAANKAVMLGSETLIYTTKYVMSTKTGLVSQILFMFNNTLCVICIYTRLCIHTHAHTSALLHQIISRHMTIWQNI